MLLEPTQIRSLSVSNRVVMSPMTRSRALGNVPNDLMATYYAQRASAGLIVTEGTSPSAEGLGYSRIPGLFNAQQVQGWKKVTDAVHAQGGRIVVQLMHTGRVGHQANLPAGSEVISSAAGTLDGQIWTDAQGMQNHSPARAMTQADIDRVVQDYAQSARLAIEAGFDGVELHGANGYLIEQFLNANVNQRSDAYGGSAQARNRFALEIARASAAAIGADKVGIRLSPYGAFNGTGAFEGVDEQYLELVRALSDLGLMYVHVLDHAAMGAPAVPASLKAALRAAFKGPFILAGGFDGASAEAALAAGQADLVAFGRPFISNPDLVARLRTGAAWQAADPSTFYSADAKGYTDYPALQG